MLCSNVQSQDVSDAALLSGSNRLLSDLKPWLATVMPCVSTGLVFSPQSHHTDTQWSIGVMHNLNLLLNKRQHRSSPVPSGYKTISNASICALVVHMRWWECCKEYRCPDDRHKCSVIHDTHHPLFMSVLGDLNLADVCRHPYIPTGFNVGPLWQGNANTQTQYMYTQYLFSWKLTFKPYQTPPGTGENSHQVWRKWGILLV